MMSERIVYRLAFKIGGEWYLMGPTYETREAIEQRVASIAAAPTRSGTPREVIIVQELATDPVAPEHKLERA